LQSLAGASSYGKNIIELDPKCPILPRHVGINEKYIESMVSIYQVCKRRIRYFFQMKNISEEEKFSGRNA